MRERCRAWRAWRRMTPEQQMIETFATKGPSGFRVLPSAEAFRVRIPPGVTYRPPTDQAGGGE